MGAVVTREYSRRSSAEVVNTIIGKALGILIEREGITESAAFETLMTMSQNTNTKLRLVAAKLVEEAQQSGEV